MDAELNSLQNEHDELKEKLKEVSKKIQRIKSKQMIYKKERCDACDSLVFIYNLKSHNKTKKHLKNVEKMNA